jgi:hypothetical protein
MLLTIAMGGYAQNAKIDFNLAAGDQNKIGIDSVWAVNDLVKFEVRCFGVVHIAAHQLWISYDSTYFSSGTTLTNGSYSTVSNGAVEDNILLKNMGEILATIKGVTTTGTKSTLSFASALSTGGMTTPEMQAISVSGEGLMGVVTLKVKSAFAYDGINNIATAVKLDSIKLIDYNQVSTKIVISTIVDTIKTVPVQLTSFIAAMQSANSSILRWNTATEVKNYGFDIERRSEGSLLWKKVGFVAGSGTSNTPRDYAFQDVNLAPGVYVYRLKQIDNDGSFKYSGSAQVDVGVAGKSLELLNYPNPFNPATEIRFSVPVDGFASLKVYNMLGQEVTTLFSGMAKAGHYMPVTFNAGNMASGVYLARLEYNGKSVIQRMLFTK